MESLFLGLAESGELVRELSQASDVFTSRKVGDNYFWLKHLPNGAAPLALSAYRTTDPLKTLFFPTRKTVAVYPDQPSAAGKELRPAVLLGAKACDLRSLSILDHVFLKGDFRDPFYAERRENTLVIASDCTAFRESCFCLALGINPFPEDNYDVCISEISDGYLLTAASPRGESFLRAHERRFRPATQGQVDERPARRKKLLAAFREKLAMDRLPEQKSLQANVKRNYQSEIWSSKAKDCVECGACNLVCPTCHCFILEDHARAAGSYSRARLWDSCQYQSFAKVAGGANPRKRLAERVRNRFVKKFDFFPDTAGLYACTGCGRCSEACIAKIDIREVLKELAST